MQAFIERFARTPWLHYWEQRLIGMGFYRQIKSFLKNEGVIRPGLRILEVGCGQGVLAGWFKDGRYVGIDTDFESLKFAGRRFLNHSFLSGDAVEVPIRNEAFDTVLSVGVFHHLNNLDLIRHFQEMQRVLKKGGKFLVFDSLKPDPKHRLKSWFSTFERGAHLRTLSELKASLNQAAVTTYRFYDTPTALLQSYTLVIPKF